MNVNDLSKKLKSGEISVNEAIGQLAPSTTNLYEALLRYWKLVSFEPEMYQNFLWACFKKFNIVTEMNINSFFSLYKMIGYDDIYYKVEEHEGIKFKVSDTKKKADGGEVSTENPEIGEGYQKVPDVQNQIDTKYEDLKSLGSFLPLLKSFHIFSTIRGEHLLRQDSLPEIEVKKYLCFRVKDQPNPADLVMCSMIVLPRSREDEVIVEINNEVFYYFGKSILNAEYLFLDTYGQALKFVEVLFDKGMALIGQEFQREAYPCTVRSFVKLAWYAEEICKHIERILKCPASHLVSANTNREARFSVLPLPDRFVGKGNTLPYELFLESVLDMTLIDHCYQTSAGNLEKLFLLLEREKLLGTNFDRKLDAEFSLIRKIARKKAATLIVQMLAQDKKNAQSHNLQYYFNVNSDISWDEYLANIKREGIPSEVAESNKFILTRNCFRNRVLPLKKIPFGDERTYPKDIRLYDDSVRMGIECHCEMSKLLFKENGGFHSAETVLNELGRRECRLKDAAENDRREDDLMTDEPWYSLSKFTPSAFIKVLKIVIDDVEERLRKDETARIQDFENIQKEVEQLKVLLDQLRLYFKVYKDSVSYQYRPVFESSFYCFDDDGGVKWLEGLGEKVLNYNKEDLERCFFFASFGCTPVNLEYLDFVHIHRSSQQRKLSIKLQELRALKDKHDVECNRDNVLSELDGKSKEVRGRINQDIEKTAERLRRESIQYLGIFATFLAFVTISLGMVKVACNIYQYMLFCLSFTGALAFFVLILHCRQDSLRWDVMKRMRGKDLLLLLLLGSVVVLVVLIANFLPCGVLFERCIEGGK